MTFRDLRKAIEVANVAVEMGGDNRFRAWRHRRLDRCGIDAPGIRQDIDDNRRRADMDDRSGSRDPIDVGQDDLVTPIDTKPSQTHVESARATRRRNGKLTAGKATKPGFKVIDVVVAFGAPSVSGSVRC